jgi:hypothetical protein
MSRGKYYHQLVELNKNMMRRLTEYGYANESAMGNYKRRLTNESVESEIKYLEEVNKLLQDAVQKMLRASSENVFATSSCVLNETYLVN